MAFMFVPPPPLNVNFPPGNISISDPYPMVILPNISKVPPLFISSLVSSLDLVNFFHPNKRLPFL